MPDRTNLTALVTGASSGLGLEAAAQLGEQGYGRIIITARTEAKGESALAELSARGSADGSELLVLDLDDHASVLSAVDALSERGGQIDFLLLNAGIVPTNEVTRTAEGIETTVAATLIGHHLLTMQLLDAGLLSDRARIVIAGSEAARGDVPMFKPVDIEALAEERFEGDREAAIEALMRMDPALEFHGGNQYATVKVFAVWWAAALSERLPSGMTVNVVSPGSTPGTDAARNAPFVMRYVLLPIFKFVPGMSHSVADGASRYLGAAEYGPDVTGRFYASKPKKMTGPVEEIEMDHFSDRESQEALWAVTSKVAGGVGYPV